jgi:hypothetical protein
MAQKSLANATAEYLRIKAHMEYLTDGETYLWWELEQLFDVPMNDRGKAMFRRACRSAERLYSPLAHPARGKGIVMGSGETVGDIVEDCQKRAQNAVTKVVVTIQVGFKYEDIPERDRSYMRSLHAQNQAIIHSRDLNPPRTVKRLNPCDGSDVKIDL